MTPAHAQILYRLAQHERDVLKGTAYTEAVWKDDKISYRVIRDGIKSKRLKLKQSPAPEGAMMELIEAGLIRIKTHENGRVTVRMTLEAMVLTKMRTPVTGLDSEIEAALAGL